MAILTNKGASTPRPKPIRKTQQVQITDPEYRGNVVDTRYEDRRTLITHVEGSSWVVRYYQQMLGADNEQTPLQIGKDAVYQQYLEIQDLELKVTSPLNISQSNETSSFTVTGTATVYPSVIPNVNDVFIADVGDGREGVFTVTESTRLSILKDTAYEIEYVQIAYADEEYLGDLAKKTVKKTHFVKGLLQHGNDPIVVDEEYKTYLSLREYQQRLFGQYFGSFFNKNISSLEVPDQKCVTHDPFLTKAITSFMDTDEHSILRSVKRYNVELPGREVPRTFWDALLALSMDELPLCHEKLALVDARCFGNVPQYDGIAFSGVEDVVFPVDRRYTDLRKQDFVPGQLDVRDIRHQFVTSRLGNLSQLGKPKGTGIESLYPIHSVNKDEYYVFSEAFYFHDYPNQSQLETITRKVMSGEPVDRNTLVRLCEASHRWSRLDRFYYTPVLLILLKLAIQGY